MTGSFFRPNGVYITTSTTTLLATGPGTLHTVTVLGGSAGIITIYDNTAGSGTVISVIPSGGAGTYFINMPFVNGCTAVTAAATNCNISFY